MLPYKGIFILIMVRVTVENTMQTIKETDASINRKLENSIHSVLRAKGKEVENIYEKNLFEIAKLYFKVDQQSISKAFNYNADLINYLLKHSYLEVLWCFHLNKDFSLKKTFEQIKSMEPQNHFTIYSATGSKPWPSGKNEPRHSVCDTISKQPITSGLYENFLVPARCKALGIKLEEFTKVKNIFDLEQYATRLEFAQALHIDIVAKRIQPKIIEAIIDKLNTITLASLKKRKQIINNDLTRLSMLTLISNNFHIAKHALSATLKFYTNKHALISILEETSLKSVAHLIKNPRPENTTFGEIYEHLEVAMVDLKKTLNTPIIIALDRNHINSNIINKTLLNAFITVIKEPSDIITSYYQLSPRLKKFITETKMSKLNMLISQSSLRLEHLSIHYFIELLKQQSLENLKQGRIIHDINQINQAYLDSIKSIMKRTTLADFLRIYHKTWNKQLLMKKTLLKLAVHQGLTGNEFLKVYGLENQNISKITLFTNYTLDMIKKKKSHIYYYTFEELGEFVKKEMNKLSSQFDDEEIQSHDNIKHSMEHASIRKPPENNPKKNSKKDEIERPQDVNDINAMEKRSTRTRPLFIIAPTLLCVFGSMLGLAGWIYYEKRKIWRSAW